MNTDGKRRALIFGISDYTDYNLERLDFCKTNGLEVYEVLGLLGYQISDKNRLVGEVKGEKVKDAISDFFDSIDNQPDDTLLLYYSGHGLIGVDGDLYLSSSDTDPGKPNRNGFSFDNLIERIQKSISAKVVIILDCFYSGMMTSKGDGGDDAKLGRKAINEKIRKIVQGHGKYIFYAGQSTQEAYALTRRDHSIYTYYLLQGLKGETESVDSEGYVTPQSLAKYVYRAFISLPADKRPKQTPITRAEITTAEESGGIILAYHPELKRKSLNAVLTRTSDSTTYYRRDGIRTLDDRRHKDPEYSWLSITANVIPILNGTDPDGNVIYLGPHATKIHRYLLIVFVAKSFYSFRLGYGKEIDGSIYFTLYGLGKVAESFKQIGPYQRAIHYDRTIVASGIYTMLSNNGLVAIRKIDGETYIKITEKGDDISNQLLQELITYGQIANMNKRTDSDERFKAKNEYDPESQKVQKRLAEKICEINLPFKDKLKIKEEEEELRRLDDRRHK